MPFALALLVCLALPAHAAAQTSTGAWATLRQEVEVDMTAGDGSADVFIRYELGSREPEEALPLDRPIDLEMLGFARAVADEVTLDDGEVVVLWPTVGSHRAAVVEPPFDADGETLRITARYTVEDVAERPGVSLHARIPILTGPPVRAESGEAVFTAVLLVPERWTLTEAFPSGLGRADDGAHLVSLRVAPSIVGFRARTDGSWRPGFPLMVDLLTVLVLVTFAGFGWRHLRSVAAGKETP
ncbi:MAG: hypothetical protein R3253_00415 [Longimicrobiales bacterium]|nr:hypothetical protein [Longimicrobiales bacterium]